MVRAKDLKLKGYKGWNIFLLIILFLALIAAGIEGGYALSSLIVDPNFFISGEGKKYLPMYIAIWASALLVFVLVIIEIISLAKINRRIKNNLEVKASHFGSSIFVSVMVMLSVIGGWAYYFIANKISFFPFAMRNYVLFGGALSSFILVLIILLFDLSPIKQIKKLNKEETIYTKSDVRNDEIPSSVNTPKSTSAEGGTSYFDVPDHIPTEELTDTYNYFARPFTLPTLSILKDMNSGTFFTLLYTDLLLHQYSEYSDLLGSLLCKDQTKIDILMKDSKEERHFDIVFKVSMGGFLYVVFDYPDENALVVARLIEDKEAQKHEFVFFGNEEEDPLYLSIMEAYVKSKRGVLWNLSYKMVQLLKSIPTIFDEQYAPVTDSETRKKAKKKRKVPVVFSVLWAIIKYTIGWFIWLFVQIILFIIDFFAHTEFAENFKDGFFGRERKIIIEDETGQQHTLSFSNGSYYDEFGHRWTKDGDSFYRD